MTPTATGRNAGFIPLIAGRTICVALLSVMAGVVVSLAHGVTTAACAGDAAKAPSAAHVDLAPVNLAGRWKGPRYAFNMRSADPQNCGGKACELTYDIVPCPDGWCGIMVSDAAPCGPVAVRLKPESAAHRQNAFTGKLELAKGSAPYSVEAWYQPPGETAGEGSDQAHLNFVGDTGDGGMLMLRRSFPFQAELARISDAQCTLAKATS